MPAPLTPVDTDYIVKHYLAGESCQQIASALNVGVRVVHNRLDKRGIERRKVAKLTAVQVEELIDRYVAGESQNQLAAAFGITQSSVYRWIKKHGVQITRSEAERRKWETMSAAQRSAQVASAHEAVRGTTRTHESLVQAALTRERVLSHATDEERVMATWLTDRGIEGVTLQKAVSKYNVDIAAAPVAVELFGGGWHSHGLHRERLPERTRDLANHGWNLLIVWTHKVHPLGSEVADEIVSFVERSRSDPAFRRQYRVIWGDGKFIASGCVDDDKLTLIPSGIRGTYGRA